MIPENPAIANIDSVIKSGRMPHSFLLEGGSAEDRAETALYIAKAVVCEGDIKPCGSCRQCRTADSDSNVDIIYIEPENDKKFISVDRIRKLRADAYIKPHSAEKKVFIIRNAELMNEQAQNALLKVLEEPPESVVFVLSSPSRTLLLPTVISRCGIFMLSGEIPDETCIDDAKKIIEFIFESENYELLKLLKSYEKDRLKAVSLLRAVQKECLGKIANGNISNFRKKTLSRVYDSLNEYIALITRNVNMSLLFAGFVSKLATFKD